MKKKENKLVTISLRLEKSDKKKLESICETLKSNKSEVTRDILKKFINVLN